MRPRLFAIGSVQLTVLLSIAAPWWGITHVAQAQDGQTPMRNGKPVEVTAQLLIVQRRFEALDGKPGERRADEDYMATQQVLLRSPEVIGRAVTKHKLQDLRWFTGRSAASVIRESFTVRRIPAAGPVIELTIWAPEAAEGVTVLNAVIEAYSEFLTETYRNVGVKTVALVDAAREQLETQVAARQRAYAEAQAQERPGNREEDEVRAVLAAVAARRASLLVARQETEGRIAWLEKARADKRAAAVVQLRINDWSARAGFDKLSDATRREVDATQAYEESLKQALEENKAVERSLDQLTAGQRQQLRAILAHNAEVDRLRVQFEQSKDLYHAIVKRLQEVKVMQDSMGYDVRILAPPGARANR